MSTTECLAGWCAEEEWCAVSCAASVVGRKWHPSILARLLEEPCGFAVLEADLGVSSSVLSESLADLAEKGIVERRIVNDRPFRVEYALTDRGASLEPVIDAMAAWGRAELAD